MRYKYIVTSDTERIIAGQRLKSGDVFFLDNKVRNSSHFDLVEEPKKKIEKVEKKKIKDNIGGKK
jgi:hypothetical protein